MPGLGRIPDPDDRDWGYFISDRLPELRNEARLTMEPRTFRYWAPSRFAPFNQNDTPHCVAFSGYGWMTGSPVRSIPALDAHSIYFELKKIDGFPQSDGSTIRALAKYLQSIGRIANYVWADSVQSARDFLLYQGTLVAGTDWYEGFFTPDADGFIWPTGRVAGGHAYHVIGYSQERNSFRAMNSWGDWSQRGRFWIRADVFEQLLHEDGEMMAGLETPL